MKQISFNNNYPINFSAEQEREKLVNNLIKFRDGLINLSNQIQTENERTIFEINR